jgi:hypothetical protein
MEVCILIGHFLDYRSDTCYEIDQAVKEDHTYILGNPDVLRLDHVRLMLSQIVRKGD